MFRNKLKYYHGTSISRWNEIKKDKMFKPSHSKEVGQYWITKGVYFVCENPYIALWYAHVAASNDKCTPIVLCFEYEADKEQDGRVLNLLTADGHKVLSYAHSLYAKKINSGLITASDEDNENLDSVSLQLLLKNSNKVEAIIASFQEGKSFQSIQHSHDYNNKYVPSQTGFSPGDHVEICFYPKFDFEKLQLQELSKSDILDNENPYCIWKDVCNGLTESLPIGNFKNKLIKALENN